MWFTCQEIGPWKWIYLHRTKQRNAEKYGHKILFFFPEWDSNLRSQCFSLPRVYALSMRPKAVFSVFAVLCTTPLFRFSVRKQAILTKAFVGFLSPCGEIPNVIFSFRTLHCSPWKIILPFDTNLLHGWKSSSTRPPSTGALSKYGEEIAHQE